MKPDFSRVLLIGMKCNRDFRQSKVVSCFHSFKNIEGNTVLLLFFLNHMKSLHTLKSYRNANQNYNEESPHTGQNDLCQKVHKQ